MHFCEVLSQFGSPNTSGKIRVNPILHEVFDQHIFHGGANMLPYQTSEPKVMKSPNLACGLVFTKFF